MEKPIKNLADYVLQEDDRLLKMKDDVIKKLKTGKIKITYPVKGSLR